MDYLLQFLCKPNQYGGTSPVIRGPAQIGGKCQFPGEVEQGDPLPSCFSSYSKTMSFSHLFGANLFFCIFVLLVGDFAVSSSAEVPSRAPKGEQVVTGLTEKIGALDQLPSGKSFSAAGCEFKVNASKIKIK